MLEKAFSHGLPLTFQAYTLWLLASMLTFLKLRKALVSREWRRNCLKDEVLTFCIEKIGD
jgi:hypothetical protein